ncbi:hypothetical protein C5L38_32380 [Streptomyces sp. WAC00288]|nr:hypothetical protein C5L38_32380 [Streptomyces sp. WAC00288]
MDGAGAGGRHAGGGAVAGRGASGRGSGWSWPMSIHTSGAHTTRWSPVGVWSMTTTASPY